MTKLILRTICLGLISVFAVACGGAGDGQLEEDPGFIEEGDLVVDEGENDPNDQEPNDDVVEDDEVDEGPVCGDGILDESEQCDDGNVDDGDGCSGACEHEVVQLLGQIDVDVTVDDLESNEEPLTDSCSGSIEIDLDVGVGSIVGDGRCTLDNFNNFLDYELDATIVETGVVEGTLNVIMNGRSNLLPVDGFIDKDLVTLQFDGVTLLTNRIRGVWSGEIEAARD